jgi:SAM-dependent methyltransferase
MIPFLAKNFHKVYAVDISKKMVLIAGEKAKKYPNVVVKRMDALDIHRLKQKFDVIVSVNSLLMPNIVKVNKVIKKCHRC